LHQRRTVLQAYVVEHAGGPFAETDLPRPESGATQVLVRVQASGVNPLDTKIRAGKAGHASEPLPAVLGLDMAGIIEEVGSGVSAFHSGDEVYGVGRIGRRRQSGR
jgi:NADPH2:quinone reductase